MLTKTAKALEDYDRFEASADSMSKSYDEKLEERRKAVAIAFSQESPNSVDRCLELIYPGPKIAGVGKELSFVRQMVEMSKTSDMKWNPRLVEYSRVRGFKDPAKLLASDDKAMMGFHFWIEEKWTKWYTSIGVGHLSIEQRRLHADHKAFDKWLAKEKS